MGGKKSKPEREYENAPPMRKGNTGVQQRGPASKGVVMNPLQMPGCSVFDVIDDSTGVPARLIIDFPQLHHTDANYTLILSWPIKFMRGYGQKGDVFSFETGRKCPTGVGTYFFRVLHGRDLFVELNRIVSEHNHGVGSDRYDHTANFNRQSVAEGTYYNHLGQQVGGVQDMYAQLDKSHGHHSTAPSTDLYSSLQRGGPPQPENEYNVAVHKKPTKSLSSSDEYSRMDRKSTAEAGNDYASLNAPNHYASPLPDHNPYANSTPTHAYSNTSGGSAYASLGAHQTARQQAPAGYVPSGYEMPVRR